MAFGFDAAAILDKLLENPEIKKVVVQFSEVANGVVIAMKHFNGRFDTLENEIKSLRGEIEKLVLAKEHPSNVAPAGDDGLLRLLEESGQTMRIQEIGKIPEDVNADGSAKKLIQ